MDSYQKINRLLLNIKSAKGTNAKKSLLEEGLKSDFKEDLILVLKHLYDPQIITGISKKKFESADGILNPDLDYWTLPRLLDFLHENITGKKEDVEFLKSLYYSKKEHFLLYSLITKDINIGISRGTVEKYIKIPKFEIMLGIRPDINDINWDREFVLTEKLDGVNLTCIKRDSDIRFLTRQGKEVSGLNNLIKEYQQLPNGVYFGEALYDGPSKDRKELFRLTTGELSQKKENKLINHYVFDYASLTEWDKEEFIRTYKSTIFHLREVIQESLKHIKTVPLVYIGKSKEDALNCLNRVKKDGSEGLVLRYSSSVYEKKRSDNFIKLKPFQDCDLRIISFKEFKHPNMLGSFIVDYKGFPVNVGSGLTKEQRIEFWQNRDQLKGKIIEIQFMDETSDKEGNLSLRFPTFVRLRPDKEEESYN